MTAPTLPSFPCLCVLDDPRPRDGASNMALDEALLRDLTKLGADRGNERLVVLRAYRWERPNISFGYFGQADVVRSEFPDCPLVRRWTGGGAVAHGEAIDWTYSLLVPRSLPFCALPAAESYRSVHTALARALEKSGLGGTSLAAAPADPDPGRPDRASGACFTQPVRADVFRNGRKIAGAAQRRTAEGLLHQGSVQGANLRLDGAARVALIDAFVTELITADSTVHRWRVPLEDLTIFAATLSRAATLECTKYGTSAWLEKR